MVSCSNCKYTLISTNVYPCRECMKSSDRPLFLPRKHKLKSTEWFTRKEEPKKKNHWNITLPIPKRAAKILAGVLIGFLLLYLPALVIAWFFDAVGILGHWIGEIFKYMWTSVFYNEIYTFNSEPSIATDCFYYWFNIYFSPAPILFKLICLIPINLISLLFIALIIGMCVSAVSGSSY